MSSVIPFTYKDQSFPTSSFYHTLPALSTWRLRHEHRSVPGTCTLDFLVGLTGTCGHGETEALVEVEVHGFTQRHKQKVSLGEQITKLRIAPSLLTGDINLNSEKMAQLTISVTEMDTGNLL